MVKSCRSCLKLSHQNNGHGFFLHTRSGPRWFPRKWKHMRQMRDANVTERWRSALFGHRIMVGKSHQMVKMNRSEFDFEWVFFTGSSLPETNWSDEKPTAIQVQLRIHVFFLSFILGFFHPEIGIQIFMSFSSSKSTNWYGLNGGDQKVPVDRCKNHANNEIFTISTDLSDFFHQQLW